MTASPAELLERPWSKSSLSTLLEGCSWQWALKKVYGLDDPGTPATAMGTAMHDALEAHERRRIVALRTGDRDRALDPMPLDALIALAQEALVREAAEITAAAWEQHGTDLAATSELLGHTVGNWWSADAGDGRSLRDRIMAWRPVLCEPGFRVPLEGVEGPGIHGFIDWLGYDHDLREWVVVDYKSAGRFSYWPHGGGGHEVEAATYVLASEIARNLPVAGSVRMEWHVARKTPPSNHHAWQGARAVVRHVTENDRALLHGQVQAARRTVELSAYQTNTSWNLCSQKWCAFYKGCQGDGSLAPGSPHLPQVV